MGEFVMQHLGLVALFLASGVMLAWPELSRLVAGSNEVGTLDATRLMNQGAMLVLDIRNAEDFATGHLARARNIPLKELDGRVAEIAKFKEKAVLITCTNGMRAAAASRALKRAGFNTVYQLKGGLAAWKQASLPLEK